MLFWPPTVEGFANMNCGLSAGGGTVFVPGSDSTLYAFGFDIEK